MKFLFCLSVLIACAVYVRSETCTVNGDCTLTSCASGYHVICEHPTGAGVTTNGGQCVCAVDDQTCTTRDDCIALTYNCQNNRKHCYDGKCICTNF